MLGAAAVTPLARSGWHELARDPAGPGFRIRTITAGSNLQSFADTRAIDAALRARLEMIAGAPKQLVSHDDPIVHDSHSENDEYESVTKRAERAWG